MKKGYAIILDAMLAIVFTITLFSAITALGGPGDQTAKFSTKKLHYTSEDTLDALNKIGTLDAVGSEWALSKGNESDPHFINATTIAIDALEPLLPSNAGYMVLIDDQVVVNETGKVLAGSKAMTHASRLLVGYSPDKPVRATVARAFLTNIRSKETSSYTYFGGFIGQGNISTVIRDLPNDAQVIRCCIEANTPSEFEMFIDGASVGTFTPSGGNMSANLKEGVSAGSGNGCVDSADLSAITPGINNDVAIHFTENNISNHYLGGGFIHIIYNTSEMDTDPSATNMRHYLPGVDGIINIYDSFYVPGNIDSMNINLDILTNYSVFMLIGDTMVADFNGTGDWQNIAISNSDLLTAGLIYQPPQAPDSLSQKTIPLRIGTGEFASYDVGLADIVFLIDSTGSMGDEIDDVYEIVEDFTDMLSTSAVDFRLALIEYKDYPQTACGGAGDFPYLKHSFSTSYFDLDSDSEWNGGAMENISVENGVIKIAQSSGTPSENLDISQTSNDANTAIYGNYELGQTFTPSVDGNLTRVSLRVRKYSNPPALQVEIRDVDGGKPGSTIIASATRGDIVTGSYNNYDFTFADPPHLSAGVDYAIVMRVLGNGGASNKYYNIRRAYVSPNGPYPDGEFTYSTNAGSSWTVYTYYDQYFRTYMLSSPYLASAVHTKQFDALSSINWGSFSQLDNEPSGTQITYGFRSSDDLSLWSSWDSDLTNAPDARYLEQRIILESSGTKTPSVDMTSIESATKDYFTTSTSAFKTEVNDITASGGWDLPESHLRAINESAYLDYRPGVERFNIMITDAPPHATECSNDLSCNLGPKSVNDMIDLMKSRDIKFFYINKASGLCNNRIMADNATNLTDGRYYEYTESNGVQDLIMEIAGWIVNMTYSTQASTISGDYHRMSLSPDSYIEFNYDPLNESSYGSISITESTPPFDDTVACRGGIDVPEGVVISSAKVTSYSSEYWTDMLRITNDLGTNTPYNLGSWATDGSYISLGDPYIVDIPAILIQPGYNNTVVLTTGYNTSTQTGCSPDNRGIFTYRVKSSTSYGDLFGESFGCNWEVQFDDDTIIEATIPSSYAGDMNCSFTETNISYIPNDAVSDAVYRLFDQLDVNNNSKVDIMFDADMIDFETAQTGGVRSLWGPAVIKLVMWL